MKRSHIRASKVLFAAVAAAFWACSPDGEVVAPGVDAVGSQSATSSASGTGSGAGGGSTDTSGSTGSAGSGVTSGGDSSFCEGRACGANYSTGEWCGSPCPRGDACSEAGQCGAFPGDLDAIYNGDEDWQLPPCDKNDEPGANLANAAKFAWVKTMTTTATDCPPVITTAHPMAMIGNVATEDTSVPVYGSCVNFSDGQWGTAYDGHVVWGASWFNKLFEYVYLINWRASIDHNKSPASGKGVVHLTRLPDLLGVESCSIEMDVTYERCPDERDDCGSHPAPF